MFLHTAQNSGSESQPDNEYSCLKAISGVDDERIKVLLVDDESGVLDVTKIFLEKKGNFIVKCCNSAEMALRELECGCYDAVVSDYGMPGMNGLELLFEIRSSGSDIPFIFFTGKGREEVVIEAINNGADYYIRKGGDPKSLFAELSHVMTEAVYSRRYEVSAGNSDRFISGLFHHLPDPTYAVNRDGVVIAWNRAIEEMTGVHAGDVVGRKGFNPSEVLYGTGRPSLADLLLNSGAVMPDNYNTTTNSGSMIIAEISTMQSGELSYMRAKGTYLYDGDGSVAGAIESVRDITEWKVAEMKLKRMNEYRKALIESHIDPLVTLSPDLRITDVNGATEKLLGCGREDIVNCHLREWLLNPEAADGIFGSLADGKAVRDHRLNVLKKSGEKIAAYLYATAYLDAEGDVKCIFAELHEPLPFMGVPDDLWWLSM
ncbi:response regulator [Methanoplanus endosymbiosus]|uniref:Response regulator n=1 Tax=Methanoplanus endosymbiosus TaxID=33865 RepID=A0A9E7TLA8_9EURY|nr:response regulator [Methanoplanus endosymbiosus]UUX93540.1 response regulator [Methanoplanus endosymbiosus]